MPTDLKELLGFLIFANIDYKLEYNEDDYMVWHLYSSIESKNYPIWDLYFNYKVRICDCYSIGIFTTNPTIDECKNYISKAMLNI